MSDRDAGQVRLTSDEREALADVFMDYRRGRFVLPAPVLAAVERILSARLLVGERCGHPNACPHERHGYVPGSAFPIGDAKSDLDRMARVLMTAWEEAEKARVGVTYVASFVDMARAALAARQSADTEEVQWGVRLLDGHVRGGTNIERLARSIASDSGAPVVRRTVITGEWTAVEGVTE